MNRQGAFAERPRPQYAACRLPDPMGVIHALVGDLKPQLRPLEAESRANHVVALDAGLDASLNARSLGDRSGSHRSVVSVALPLTDNDRVPFPIELLRSVLGEILAVHGGATLRPAFGLCATEAGIEIDALVDVEIWTHEVALLVRQAERWRVLLTQREIVVRVFDRVTLRSVIAESDAARDSSRRTPRES